MQTDVSSRHKIQEYFIPWGGRDDKDDCARRTPGLGKQVCAFILLFLIVSWGKLHYYIQYCLLTLHYWCQEPDHIALLNQNVMKHEKKSEYCCCRYVSLVTFVERQNKPEDTAFIKGGWNNPNMDSIRTKNGISIGSIMMRSIVLSQFLFYMLSKLLMT